MSVAFWSIKVTTSAPQEIQPPEGYVLNLQSAALEIKDGSDTTGAYLSLKAESVDIEGKSFESVLGTLRPVTADQISIGSQIFLFFLCYFFPQ